MELRATLKEITTPLVPYQDDRPPAFRFEHDGLTISVYGSAAPPAQRRKRETESASGSALCGSLCFRTILPAKPLTEPR